MADFRFHKSEVILLRCGLSCLIEILCADRFGHF